MALKGLNTCYARNSSRLPSDGFDFLISLSGLVKWTKIWCKTFDKTWKPFKDISHFCYITHSMSPLKNRVSNSLTLLFTHKLHLAVHILHALETNNKQTLMTRKDSASSDGFRSSSGLQPRLLFGSQIARWKFLQFNSLFAVNKVCDAWWSATRATFLLFYFDVAIKILQGGSTKSLTFTQKQAKQEFSLSIIN